MSNHAPRVQVVTLAHIEAHTQGAHGQPFRELLPFELRALSGYFRVPNPIRSAEAETILAGLRWISASARSTLPTVYAGDADGGEQFRCRDHGCSCGFAHIYAPGEPMAVPAP
ncbi:hypothetical protein ACF1A5_13350 [Streptomyces sp. NPDC014864]|uniref:hypothetical protein n=1 Tax=Streptomyces sp. NPDC014864 TaxID=3364924 RepID=UPI003700F7E9